MIRVIMLGRTGNNLFQYAYGRALAERHGVPLVMDGSFFNRKDWSAVSRIGALPLKAELRRRFPLVTPICKKLLGKHPWEILYPPALCEPYGDHSFRSEFHAPRKYITLAGFFQSPLYFEGIEESLRRELDMTALPWDPETEAYARDLAQPGTVALHARRTDYTNNRDVNFLGASYYRDAILEIRERVPGARFYLFSDDPALALKDFNLKGAVHNVIPPSADPLRDLYLMSLAAHHIIPNSTYSWWSAWIGKKEGQHVILPDRWYRDASIAPIKEKLCPGWRTIPTQTDENAV